MARVLTGSRRKYVTATGAPMDDGERVSALIDDFFDAMDARGRGRFSELNAQDEDIVHVGTDEG